MKSETQGKLMVALLVSILAFGFGTGAAMVTGLYQAPNSSAINTTQPPNMPSIPTSSNNANKSPSSSSGSQNTPSQQTNPSSNTSTNQTR